MSASARRRTTVFLRFFLAALLLLLLPFLGKGLALQSLAGKLHMQTTLIGEYYGETVRTEVQPLLLESGASLTEGQRTILGTLLQHDISLDGSAAHIDSITDVQQRLHQILLSAPEQGALSRDPHFLRLQHAVERDGTVQSLLDTYNKLAQKWNNQKEVPLGSVLFSLFHLQPQQLLNADGKVEFETVIAL